MAEKILNTRILMKVDTLENWNKSTLPLKKGELAFATVAATAGTGLTEPVVMVKIGEDGVKTFKDLSWNFYAKASDVLSACKDEAALKTFINGVITDAGVATDDALKTLSTQVTTNKDDIAALKTAVGDADSGLVKAVADLETLVGDTKVADQITAAITALDLANTYDAKGAAAQALTDAKGYADGLNTAMNTRVEALEAIDHDHANKAELDLIETGDKAKWDAMEQNAKDYADGLNTAMDGRVADLEAMFGDGEGTVESQIAAAVATETEAREAADTALSNRVKAIEDDYLKAADKTALQDQITANDGDIAALQGLVGDTKVSEAIDAAVAVEKARAEAAEKVNSDAIAVLNGNAETEGSVDYKIAQKFSTLMENPDEAMNSIQELVDWTTEHAADALEMSNQVTANKNAIATLNGDASTAGSVDKKVADAVAAEKSRAEGVEGGLDTRLAAVEAAVGETGSVATAIEEAVTEAKGYTDTEVKKLADGAVATNAADIDALEAKVGDETVAAQIEAAIEALKIGDYAKAADLTAAVGRIAQNETDIDALEGRMDTAEGDIDVLETEVAKKANDADLAAIAKTGNVNDLVQTDGDVLIFDCGTSAV